MCGTLIGTLPQIAQQNVFLGLPLQLMPEEAAYLVRHAYAYVVDDRLVHRKTAEAIRPQEVEDLKASRLRDRQARESEARRLKLEKKRAALKARGLTHLLEQLDVNDTESVVSDATTGEAASDHGSTRVPTVSNSLIYKPQIHNDATSGTIQPNPKGPRYDLFQHLHSLNYYLTPGLRFGAQFVAYPGDPLRFHSHFVASGHAWDDEIPIMDIVGGGRLGTGVKKAWLVGGMEPESEQVKCFTVEWAGM